METRLKKHQKVIKQYITDTQFLFHCHIKIKLPIDVGEKYLDECFEIMRTIDQQYNSYSEGSYFDLINKNAGNWVEVDAETITMLNHILDIQTLTDGIYNIGMIPLLKLWGFYDLEINKIPTQESIEKVLTTLKSNYIEIEDHRVRISRTSEIMTGSFIKAFAVDKVICFLRSKGVSDAIVNAGGSTIYGLNDDEHPYWKIDIPHFREPDKYGRLFLQNACFSLSGRKRHFVEIENRKYGHIINAKSGFPSKNVQAGTITKTAFLGDILSTVLMANDNDVFVSQQINKHYGHILLESYVIEEER
ncbi:FAD:protein FMN transferase [Chryseobacterium sp. OSA05B]|uniref:FAD:protein FMN transferase n=1 Tax=Chryseobacterium sp. OSA05B TaxID=2862650 RepID=UPI001CBC3CFC|nr:FAD:protein FMN transferase [Chryseobacterium sp. OSA05B]